MCSRFGLSGSFLNGLSKVYPLSEPKVCIFCFVRKNMSPNAKLLGERAPSKVGLTHTYFDLFAGGAGSGEFMKKLFSIPFSTCYERTVQRTVVQ